MRDNDDDEYESDYAARNGELARERAARREAEQDRRDRAASLRATKAQLKAALGHNGSPAEPEYKPKSEWSTTERQVFAAKGIKPLKADSGYWYDRDDDD